ncbi:MAG: LPXTG cell wall anchor domain-containing protein [Octadecabacter sp.]|nr:LPXTG cell wall anchor domain-containing protein [Octadecabacter sp.]
MRLPLALLITLAASPAFAHIGHLADVGGHGHWIALGGIAIAAGIALLGGRKKKAADQVEDESEDHDKEEAPA